MGKEGAAMQKITWRIRLARWLLSSAARLAWRIGGKAAYGRGLLSPRERILDVTDGLWAMG